MSRPSSSCSNRSRDRRCQPRQKFCSFCKNIGKNPFGHIVRECEELKKIECPNCGKNGHTIKYCPYIEKCEFCQRVGHKQDTCYYNPSNKVSKCRGCKRFGHTFLECYNVSQEDKRNYKEQVQKKINDEKRREEEDKKRLEEFKKKGFTYSKSSLEMYKKGFEQNPNYIPWIIFCDSEDEDDEYEYGKGLTDKEKMRLEKIKYEVSMLE